MELATHPVRIPVRHGQRLTDEGLRLKAVEAVKKSGILQADLALRLKVTQPAISQALKNSGAGYTGLQRRIIAALTSYTIEDSGLPAFRVERKN